MLLGLSGLTNEAAIGTDPVGGSDAGDGGIEHGALLAAYAEAIAERDAGRLAASRAELGAAMSSAAVVDAAAVCANFHMMTRLADGTGTPLDAGTLDMSADLRRDLGLDDLTSRRVAG